MHSRRDFFRVTSAGIPLLSISGASCDSGRNAAPSAGAQKHSERLIRNARLVLEASCRAQAGESLIILADDVLVPYAPALAEAADEIGVVPLVIDIRRYLASEAYAKGAVLEPLRSALEGADIVIENLADTWVPNRPDFGRLVGDPDYQDKALTSERRWVIIQPRGMEEWNVSAADIALIRKRTEWLKARLATAENGRITSAGGTDIIFALRPDAMFTPVLGIVPFYGEVAVTPCLKGTTGIFVADGPSQREIRPRNELDRNPLTITVENGRATGYTGDSRQIERLKAFIASGDPPADAVDEVGIITTSLMENDVYYWSDGTHHHDCVHIALGNNVRRDVVVHGPKHADFEVRNPTISLDGLVITRDGVFQDSVLDA